MHRLSERSTQPIDLAVAGRARQRRRSQWYFFTTSHGLEGEFLPCALALAKRRQWRGYDAVKLAAAYDIPGHCSYGLLGLRGKYSILKITQGSIVVLTTAMLPICKIKIRYHEAGTVYLYSARPYSCGFDFATKISKANPQKN